MNLHVFFHGMMVFEDKGDTIEVHMPSTPPATGGGVSEHEYVLIPSEVGAPIGLMGSHRLQISMTSAEPAKAVFDPRQNVIFPQGTKISNSRVKVTLTRPHLITGVRNCQRINGTLDFFLNAPNNPTELPSAHVFSYKGVDSVKFVGPAGQLDIQSNIIAFHAEEPTSTGPSPNGDEHLRHVRKALGKPSFRYVGAMVAPGHKVESILGDSIAEFWSQALVEKKQKGIRIQSPGNPRSPLEDNPCFQYVVASGTAAAAGSYNKKNASKKKR